MASLAQVAGQYVFLLFNADGIGADPASGWVLLVGVLWIVAMTYVAYRGIELSASFQKALLSIELVMLLVLSTVALVKVGSARNLWMQGILPVAGGLMLYFLGGWSVWLDYNVATENDYTMWTVPGIHWQVGGAFVIAVIAVLIGLACYIYCRITRPAFFTKQTLTRATPTLTPDPSLPEEGR